MAPLFMTKGGRALRVSVCVPVVTQLQLGDTYRHGSWLFFFVKIIGRAKERVKEGM